MKHPVCIDTLWQSTGQPALLTLARQGQLRHYRKHTLLIEQGDVGHQLYMVLAGRLREFSMSQDSKPREITLSVLGAGQMVGVPALDGGTHCASVMALTPVSCVVVSRESALAVLQHSPGLALDVLKLALQRVRQAGVSLCCGGIIGMGESLSDRASLLQVLASLDPHPESVPINALVAVEGTPLQEQAPVDPLELVRMVATARILMPHSRVRLSAGREGLSREAQILCLLAGADSIFYGDTLLTTANPQAEADRELLAAAGVTAWPEQTTGADDTAQPCRL